MKKLLIFCLTISCAFLLYACQDQARLKLSQRVNYLVKDTVLYEHFLMEWDGVATYASAYEKSQEKAEFKIYYNELETFSQLFKKLPTATALDTCLNKQTRYFSPLFVDELRQSESDGRMYSSDQPLEGLKIAIDPVHIGGSDSMAILEKKLVKVITDTNDSIFMDEGALTLATARILEIKLKKLGAQVLLTRRKPGEAAVGKSFESWLKTDFHTWVQWDFSKGELDRAQAEYLKTKADKPYIFNQYFKRKDLLARTQKINQFKPDLTVMIRYNVDEANWERRGADDFLRPTQANYCLAFVPGGFMRNELATKRDRLEFMRLLLTDDVTESTRFSRMLLNHINYKLGVPSVATDADYNFLKKSSVQVEKGVYARNLSMTRLVHGPLSYGEVLCLDNVNECVALTKKELKVGEIVTSKRVEQVADAYVDAMLEFFNPEENKIKEDDLIETGM
ncbi:MAG: hypothetical protein ACPGJS_02915 [Flammeovirgaceae bacterium]